MIRTEPVSPHTLTLVRNPVNLDWELRSHASSHVVVGLLDWAVPGTGIDAGVPVAVATLLSKALCQSAQLSFLDPASPIQLSPSFPGRLIGKPVFPLTTTSNSDTAVRLFNIDAFPWEQRAQVVILSEPGTTPVWRYQDLFELWSSSSPDLGRLALHMHAWGFAFPGVDGDFMEIAVASTTYWEQLKQTLAQMCKQHDFLWEEVS